MKSLIWQFDFFPHPFSCTGQNISMKQRLKAANEKYMYNKNILKQKSGQLSGRVPDSLLKGCGSSSGRVFIFQCQPSMLTPVLVSIPTLYWVFIFQCQPSMLTPVLVSVPTLYCVFIFQSAFNPCWLLFWFLLQPCIATVPCKTKRAWSFCQKCRSSSSNNIQDQCLIITDIYGMWEMGCGRKYNT